VSVNLDAQLAQVVRAAVAPMITESLDQLEARLVERLAELVRSLPAPTTTATVPPPLMTLNDVAGHLQVTARTVQRRVAAGDFPRPIMIGPTCPRWRREDIDAWIQGGVG
jgi:predicted DNA-binding transcriptional regulator AlpA